MSAPALSPAALAELALDVARPWHGPRLERPLTGEVPLFVNGHGPFLLRHAPLRLVPIPLRTAYALVRARVSPSLTWPPYTPTRDWVVRASSTFFNGY